VKGREEEQEKKEEVDAAKNKGCGLAQDDA
jgi:hypothetical protein